MKKMLERIMEWIIGKCFDVVPAHSTETTTTKKEKVATQAMTVLNADGSVYTEISA